MLNINLLEKRIDDSGMTMVAIAEKTGILRETLYNKLKGTSEFKASEIASISRVLGLSSHERDAIFFEDNGELNSTMKSREILKE